ncbi:MAG: hypothetical protein B6U95_00370 [Thermofilum sp. ex4484_82]|nr:MAG: hypothetical protein B6U95_00370 [Thermofilum sp. ex4484_82]OYT40070.1 MAG: hypothetical protein B6U96_00375 [Archaeoglobales archaeon ex4484_92]
MTYVHSSLFWGLLSSVLTKLEKNHEDTKSIEDELFHMGYQMGEYIYAVFATSSPQALNKKGVERYSDLLHFLTGTRFTQVKAETSYGRTKWVIILDKCPICEPIRLNRRINICNIFGGVIKYFEDVEGIRKDFSIREEECIAAGGRYCKFVATFKV